MDIGCKIGSLNLYKVSQSPRNPEPQEVPSFSVNKAGQLLGIWASGNLGDPMLLL